ncbi:glutathione peroxidase [Aureibaculum sp. 2210JD6-5]|uniref:glutathione peroxidase n=1 Tax=Aureibaculum sp. 2210JD6-5 TaxID=3103957 RepID=UPI002AAD7B21|nr:glutathione peroxidase [Aureibaculum sp. 2210JD6-5]MDY7396699.1 glutathione peroxidase [Aureibaculum sp. 2210JD6-5]
MKKNVIIALSVLILISCKETKKDTEENNSANDTITNQTAMVHNQETMEDIYQFKVKTLTEDDFDFSSLKGKKILVVNTASKCGLTPQYEHLQKLYDTYKDDNFVVVGFPANNFGQQEPGSNTEIAEFCQQNYGVSFPMMSKISVKGDDMHPVYQFLTQKKKNGLEDSEVAWNFQKYLIDENGHVVKVISPKTLPTDDVIVNWIKG